MTDKINDTLVEILVAYEDATDITMGAKGFGTETRGTRQGQA